MTSLAWKKRSQVLLQITVEVDRLWNGDLSDYDGIFLPGGMPGAANLRDNPELIAALQEESRKGKIISAICAAPIVLARAGLLKENTIRVTMVLKRRFKMGTIRKKQW